MFEICNFPSDGPSDGVTPSTAEFVIFLSKCTEFSRFCIKMGSSESQPFRERLCLARANREYFDQKVDIFMGFGVFLGYSLKKTRFLWPQPT